MGYADNRTDYAPVYGRQSEFAKDVFTNNNDLASAIWDHNDSNNDALTEMLRKLVLAEAEMTFSPEAGIRFMATAMEIARFCDQAIDKEAASRYWRSQK